MHDTPQIILIGCLAIIGGLTVLAAVTYLIGAALSDWYYRGR